MLQLFAEMPMVTVDATMVVMEGEVVMDLNIQHRSKYKASNDTIHIKNDRPRSAGAERFHYAASVRC